MFFTEMTHLFIYERTFLSHCSGICLYLMCSFRTGFTSPPPLRTIFHFLLFLSCLDCFVFNVLLHSNYNILLHIIFPLSSLFNHLPPRLSSDVDKKLR